MKVCADHLMLVYLAPTDIVRVSESGSIKVSYRLSIGRSYTVIHIFSQVQGTLAKDKTAYDLMKATFPAGTLSGAPKVRALQIISELENSQRGLYGGALGYSASMETMILVLASARPSSKTKRFIFSLELVIQHRTRDGTTVGKTSA